MLISTKSTYALRALAELAKHKKGEYICICDLCKELDMPRKYLESIMTLLSKSKIVEVTRGKCGGYRLGKDPKEYKLIDILKVTEEDLAPVACLEKKKVKCEQCKECCAYDTWIELHELINNFFENKTLADLLK